MWPVGAFGETIASSCRSPRSRTGSRPGEKKAEKRIGGEYLDWALDDFSGYIAADELYDGPYCVLSIVDNRTFKRIAYKVLDHDPTHDDIREFFTDFKDALETRGLTLEGITTDGSALYPVPIAEVFGELAALPQVASSRSLGMIGALDLAGDSGYLARAGWDVYDAARERGAYLRPMGNCVYVTPPLTIPDDTLEELLGIVRESVSDVRSAPRSPLDALE